MAAIIGLDDETVEQLCGADDEVWPANYNCPGQVVISGAVEAVERVLAAATEAGARRAVTLKVTGAFHSPLVGAAAERLRPAVEGSRFSPAAIPFMSTVSCRMETHERVPALLLEQLSAPVRFTQAIGALVSAGVETFVEVGPGQVLAGLIKRIDRSVRVLSVADPTGLARLSAELEGAVA